MKKIFDKIINNELLYAELEEAQFSNAHEVTRENVKQVLMKRGERLRELIAETNGLIFEHISPVLKHPERELDDEKALMYEEFAKKLSDYRENIDTGLAFDVRIAVCKYAKATGNDALYIRNAFFGALALFYLQQELFEEDLKDMFYSVMEYSDRYETFERPERELIAKSFANFCINSYKGYIDKRYENIKNAEDFWNNTAKKIDPDINWGAYFMNLNENFITHGFSVLRSGKRAHTVTDIDKKRIYEACQDLIKYLGKHDEVTTHDYTSLPLKIRYYDILSRYYAGYESIDNLLDFLDRESLETEVAYDYDTIYRKIHYSALYLFYVANDADADPEKIRRKRNEVIQYAKSIPRDLNQAYVARMISNFASATSVVYDDFEHLKVLLSLSICRHKPTFVHSVMVAKIATIITEYMIKCSPEIFVGMPNMNSIEDVENGAGEIVKFVWYAGLSHDIGKIKYYHLISFYLRRLNDVEFEMVKGHTGAICEYFNLELEDGELKQKFTVEDRVNDLGFIDSNEIFLHLAHVAIGHHKAYDGKFGYPISFDNRNSKVKPIIDIITISDCIDAASDVVGRSYAKGKSLDELMKEFELGKNHAYSPVVVDLLKESETLRAQLEEAMSKFRYDTYYSCFNEEAIETMLTPPERLFDS